jgi:hypothetical protein
MCETIFSPEVVWQAIPQRSCCKAEWSLAVCCSPYLWYIQDISVSKVIFWIFSME